MRKFAHFMRIFLVMFVILGAEEVGVLAIINQGQPKTLLFSKPRIAARFFVSTAKGRRQRRNHIGVVMHTGALARAVHRPHG